MHPFLEQMGEFKSMIPNVWYNQIIENAKEFYWKLLNVKALTINMMCILGYCFTKRDQVKFKFQLDGLPWN